MTAVMLQVRLGSSRLPRKALLPLGGRKVIDLVLEALKGIDADMYAVLTDAGSREGLEESAGKHGFEMFVGPENDVLARYALAIRRFEPDTVVRATGDNPLVSAELANMLLQKTGEAGGSVDYAAFDGPPVGTGVEVVRAESLLRADREASDPYSREHVCPYLYRNPDLFRIERYSAPPEYSAPDSPVTLDTEEDYRRIKDIVASLYDGSPVKTDALVSFLKETGGTGGKTDGTE